MRANDTALTLVRNQAEVVPEEAQIEVVNKDAKSDVPNLSFDDATGLVEIETQANQLLDYISKLSSLADRACVTAIRQTETAQRSEESRHTEVATLRNQLEQSTAALQERNVAFTMLENSAREQLAALEQRLRAKERQLEERDVEVSALQRQNAELSSRPASAGFTAEQLEEELGKRTDALKQELAALQNQLSQRDESLQGRVNMFKKAEADLRAKLAEQDIRLKEADGKVLALENQLKDKEQVIQATAAKEAEIGKLIKRLSQECENLSIELQEKTRLMSQLDGRKPQTQPDKNVWRRMIGKLQDDPL